MARPCLRCQAPSSRGRQNGTAAVDPPCTCRFINGTTRHRGVGVSRQLCPSEVSEGHGFFCRNGSAFDEGGQRVICANAASKPLPICKLLPAVFSLPLRKFPRCPPLISRLAAAPIVFFSPLRQNHCQYVNYCLRSFPCLCANSLAVRLFARTSPSLSASLLAPRPRSVARLIRLSHYCSIVCEPFRVLSQNPSLSASPLTPRRCSNRIFSPLRQNHCRAEGTACSKVRTGCSPLTWKCCTPSFPSGKVLSSIMEILFPPSCGFPPKSFPLKREPTISGDTFGTRA